MVVAPQPRCASIRSLVPGVHRGVYRGPIYVLEGHKDIRVVVTGSGKPGFGMPEHPTETGS